MKYIVLSVALCMTFSNIIPSNSDISLEQRLQETQTALESKLSYLQRELVRLKLEKCTKNDIDIVVAKKLESSEYVKIADFFEKTQKLEDLLQKLTSRIDELDSRLQNFERRFRDMEKVSDCKVLLAYQIAGLQFTIQDLENRIIQLERREILAKSDYESPLQNSIVALKTPPKLELQTASPTPVSSDLGNVQKKLTTNLLLTAPQRKFFKSETSLSLDSDY